MELNKIYLEDCFETFKRIDDKSIDMILCDLPYGTTACKWDTRLPLEPLWKEYKRIIKKNGAIVLTASQPFTSILVMSNLEWFKHCWYWNKQNAGNFANALYKPLSIIEEVCVFSKGKVNYSPIMNGAKKENKRPRNGIYKLPIGSAVGMASGVLKTSNAHNENLRYPHNILNFNNRVGELNALNRLHPTQKPVALMEYLIKTYSNESDIVLDNCIGSDTTAIACINTNRHYIGSEINKEYYDIAIKRIEDANKAT